MKRGLYLFPETRPTVVLQLSLQAALQSNNIIDHLELTHLAE